MSLTMLPSVDEEQAKELAESGYPDLEALIEAKPRGLLRNTSIERGALNRMMQEAHSLVWDLRKFQSQTGIHPSEIESPEEAERLAEWLEIQDWEQAATEIRAEIPNQTTAVQY